MKLTFVMIGLLFIVDAEAELQVFNINGIGPEKLTKVKTNKGVSWWVELGEKIIVSSQSDQKLNFPSGVRYEATLPSVELEDLAFHVLGHCDHSEMDELLHSNLDVVYAGQTARLISTKSIVNKDQLLNHDSILPFEKNKVLTYQLKNRHHDHDFQNRNQVQMLVDQVDKDRWFSQVEYFAGMDRMLEADLDTAGDWLEAKFTALGLTTSRVSLHNHYRGTNVLGFKQGSSRANDWYVVGAHMDSRNRFWNDAEPSPGAEDNASGCSGVLEIANVIAQYETEASIVFMCFIEEESGLLGSADVVTQFTDDGDINKVKTMINLDMISYRGPNRNTAIAGTNSTSFHGLANTIAANGNQYTDIDWQVNLNMCCTDFVSFANAGVPAVTSNQPDISSYAGYHTSVDLASNLDPVLGAGIIRASLVTLIDLVGVDFNSVDLIFEDDFDQ